MKPALVLPLHDPEGAMLPHLQAILPDLKVHFGRAYISPAFPTVAHTESIRWLQAHDFFTIFPADREMQAGEHFAYLYRRTAETAPAEQILHLCFPDRLSFALESEYREQFLTDIDALSANDVPVVFQRSELAWQTHPHNYRKLEGIVTTVGRNLFGRELDYAWCHLAVRAGQLREIMPQIKSPDLSVVAEVLFYLQDEIKTRDVDWLAWEDPFLLTRDAKQLKQERENSLAETNKRLKYVLPMIELLTRLSTAERRKVSPL